MTDIEKFAIFANVDESKLKEYFATVKLTSTPEDVIRTTSKYFGVDITSKCRERKYISGRMYAFHIIRSKFNVTKQEIAKLLNSTHGSQIKGEARFSNLMKYDKFTRKEFNSFVLWLGLPELAMEEQ